MLYRIPPLHYTHTAGNLLRMTGIASAICCGVKLSSIITLAPASQASSASSIDRHYTSIIRLKPPIARALATAFVILPAMSMWLSFSIVIDESAYRWGSPPPITTPYFSTWRNKPGVVLRVHATLPRHDAFFDREATLHLYVEVAVPEQRLSTYSIVR